MFKTDFRATRHECRNVLEFLLKILLNLYLMKYKIMQWKSIASFLTVIYYTKDYISYLTFSVFYCSHNTAFRNLINYKSSNCEI